MSPARRVLLLVLGVAVLALVAALTPVHAVPVYVKGLGPAAPLAGVAVGTALLVALVPRTPVSIACGVLFGAAGGAICALAVAMLAATVTFVAGRWLGRDYVARRVGARWQNVEGWITREGILAVAAVRAVPLGPYGLMGYAYGASGVRVRDYALGSLIAGAPSSVTYALLGAAVAATAGYSPLTLVPLGVGLLLWATLAVRRRRRVIVI